MFSAEVAAGDGALQTLTARAVSSITKSSTKFPSGETACAARPTVPGSVFERDRRDESLQVGEKRFSVQAAPDFFHADAAILPRQFLKAVIREHLGELAPINVCATNNLRGRSASTALGPHSTPPSIIRVKCTPRNGNFGSGPDKSNSCSRCCGRRPQLKKLTAKRHDLRLRFVPTQRGQMIGIQPAARDEPIGAEAAARRFEIDLVAGR